MEDCNPPALVSSNPSQWENWLREALVLAGKARDEDEVPVGAVIIKDSRVIGRGYNRRESEQNPLAHAEILAIREAAAHLGSWRLTGCVLVVTLEPCPMCLAACQQARLERVVYGATDPKGGAISLGYRLNEDSRLNHRFPVEFAGLDDCGNILREFFRGKRSGS